MTTRTPPRRSTRGDAGAATVLVVALAGVLLLTGAALGTVTALVGAHRQAQAAADLAALAGARILVDGGEGCAAAGSVAVANGAVLTGCVVEGAAVRVSVRVDGPRWLGLAADPEAEARAGPGGPGGSGGSSDVAPPAQSGPASLNSTSSRTAAPALSSGALPLPHLGDCTHEGQP